MMKDVELIFEQYVKKNLLENSNIEDSSKKYQEALALPRFDEVDRNRDILYWVVEIGEPIPHSNVGGLGNIQHVTKQFEAGEFEGLLIDKAKSIYRSFYGFKSDSGVGYGMADQQFGFSWQDEQNATNFMNELTNFAIDDLSWYEQETQSGPKPNESVAGEVSWTFDVNGKKGYISKYIATMPFDIFNSHYQKIKR